MAAYDPHNVFEQFSFVSKMMSESNYGGERGAFQQASELMALLGELNAGGGPAADSGGQKDPRRSQAKNLENILLFLKLMEAKKRLEAYCASIMAAAAREDDDWRKGMLRSIRPNMDEDKRHVIDVILKYMELAECFELVSRDKRPPRTIAGQKIAGKRVRYGGKRK